MTSSAQRYCAFGMTREISYLPAIHLIWHRRVAVTASGFALFSNFLARLPNIFALARQISSVSLILSNMTTAKLKRFPRSTVWDKQTQRAVDGVRAFMHREPPPTISHIQNESVKARLLKGPFQATQEALPAPPEDDVKLLLFRVIAELGEAEYERPELASVPVEWIINSPSTRPAERPESTDSWVKSDSDDLTILHAHGGAFL